jgi:hypothetical protein
VKLLESTDIPIVSPVQARRGRFLVSRKRHDEFVACVRAMSAELAVRQLDGWSLVATFVTQTHEWQCYAVRAGVTR